MIQLNTPIVESNVIKPIGLACSSSNDVDVIAIGNGLTNENADEDVAPVLQYALMKTISKFKCFPYLPVVAFRKSIICSMGNEMQSICQGDSGGPLIETQSRHLVGITSFGSYHFGCMHGAPQGFKSLAYKFIRNKITNLNLFNNNF